jgi:putative tricarboxylic transport membrane protein
LDYLPFPSFCLICATPLPPGNALSDRKQVKVKIEHRRAIGILFRNWTVVIRSALIGMFTGILPGAGGSIANILAYDQAKKAAKDDSKFGKGDPPRYHCA